MEDQDTPTSTPIVAPQVSEQTTAPTTQTVRQRVISVLKRREKMAKVGCVAVLLLVLVGVAALVVMRSNKKPATKLTPQQIAAKPSVVATEHDKFLGALENFAARKNVALTADELKKAPTDKTKLIDYKVGFYRSKLAQYRRIKKGTVVLVKPMGDQLTNKPAYDANAQTTRTYMNLVGFSAIKNAKTTDEIEVAYEKAGAANGFEKMVAKYAQADQDLSKYDTSLDPSTANVTSAFLADADTVGAVSTALPFGPYSYIQFKITEIGKTGDFDTWSELYKTYK